MSTRDCPHCQRDGGYPEGHIDPSTGKRPMRCQICKGEWFEVWAFRDIVKTKDGHVRPAEQKGPEEGP